MRADQRMSQKLKSINREDHKAMHKDRKELNFKGLALRPLRLIYPSKL